MPASDLSDGYSEYIFMNEDLKNKTTEELHHEVVWLRACIRAHRDHKHWSTNPDLDLYRCSLPEERNNT